MAEKVLRDNGHANLIKNKYRPGPNYYSDCKKTSEIIEEEKREQEEALQAEKDAKAKAILDQTPDLTFSEAADIVLGVA